MDLLERTGATVATVTSGDLDLATPEGSRNKNDILHGEGGSDLIYGGKGTDDLDGGDGVDDLDGGGGTDTCVKGETCVSCELPL